WGDMTNPERNLRDFFPQIFFKKSLCGRGGVIESWHDPCNEYLCSTKKFSNAVPSKVFLRSAKKNQRKGMKMKKRTGLTWGMVVLMGMASGVASATLPDPKTV